MNDRKQALEALRDKVKAGADDLPAYYAAHAFPNGYCHAINAFHGSLDAAKALHDAVLGGGYPWSIGEEAGRLQGEASNWCVGIFSNKDDRSIAWQVNKDPARAWLIAILEALISECDE